jgi:hypothetical protein
MPSLKSYKGGKDKGGKDNFVDLDPAVIRFALSKICPNFSGCGRPVLDTLEEIKAGELSVADLPTITVVTPDGGGTYVSLNNRRLYVIKEARALGLVPNNLLKVPT